MSIKILIFLLPLVLLAILAIGSQSINDGSEGSADQLIDASNGVYTPVVDTRFPTSPKASRDLQDSRKNEGFSAEPDQISSNTNLDTKSDEKIETSESSAILSGNWSFDLDNSTLKEVILRLSQSEDMIYGMGNYKEGNYTLNVTVSGTINRDKLNLDLMPSGTTDHYLLALTVSGDDSRGDYKAISAGGKSWTGEARGRRL